MQDPTNSSNLLVCSPDYFTVSYSINPWMDPSQIVDKSLAFKQWQNLIKTFQDLGCKVNILPGVKNLPDMVFTANAGWIIGDKKIIISSFKNNERKGEEKYFKQWFQSQGYQTIQLNTPFEGVAEALFFQDKFIIGFGFRSGPEIPNILQNYLQKTAIPLHLINPKFYHLDMCLTLPRKDLLVYYPAAFDQASLDLINSLNVEKIEVSKHDADQFGCNFINFGNTVVINKGPQKLINDLNTKGFQIIEIDMQEFKKAGGGIKCLTFVLS